jgi:hypothetical protein
VKKEMDNLAKDVIRAKRMGYSSYGMYKADHPHTRQLSDVELAENRKYCPICDKPFIPTRSGHTYCSTRCKNTASMRRNGQN